MKKKTNFIITIFLCFICIYILVNSKEVMNTVLFGFDIWKNSIFPSLFPFFIISSLLINYGFVDITSSFLSPIMERVFKINKNTAFILVMSMLSGFPSNAKYTLELLNNNQIDIKSANKILLFTHFSNPLFILGTISIFLNSYKIALIILIIHYLSNFIIGLLFRNYLVSKTQNHSINCNDSKKFGTALKDAIKSSIDTLLLILGTVTTFLIITTILNKININPYVKTVLNGMIEMTQGLKYLSISTLPLKAKAVLSVMFLSFGGISVHMQVLSIISGTKIKYQPYLLARLLHCFIAGISMYFLFDIL